MRETFAFGVISLCLVGSALAVVRAVDLVRSVLWLGVTLVSTAALYALLNEPFLAGVQVLTYVGGVMTLMVFGVMLTRPATEAGPGIERGSFLRGAIPALSFFGVVSWAITTSGLPEESARRAPATGLAESLLGEHLLAFELVSLLLLAAILGAVVLARRADPGGPPRQLPGAEEGASG